MPVFNKNTKILIEILGTMADGTTIDLFPIIALATMDVVTGKNLITISTYMSERLKGSYLLIFFDKRNSLLGFSVPKLLGLSLPTKFPIQF